MIKIENKKPFRIIIIGVGGTGSNLAPYIAQLNANSGNALVLIDGDVIEEKNLRNQHFIQRNVGINKAQVIAESYKRFWPLLNIFFIPEYIKEENKDVILNMIADEKYFTIIVGCVDNNASRALLHSIFNDSSVKDLIYIDSGNGTENRSGQIVTGIKIKGEVISPCIADRMPSILTDKDEIVNTNSCRQIIAEAPQHLSTNVYAAANLFCVLTNIISYGYVQNMVNLFSASDVTVQGIC